MAERNASLKKYRDALETIINRVMEYVSEAERNAQTIPMPDKSVDMHTPPEETAGLQATAEDSEFSNELLDFQFPFPPTGRLHSGPDTYVQGPGAVDTPEPWNAFSDIFPEGFWFNELLMDMPDGVNYWFAAE